MSEEEKPLTYKDVDGTILYGIPDLNKSVQEQNKLLKRYYRLAIIFVLFVMGVIFWVIWQIKHYKIISLLINAIKGGC